MGFLEAHAAELIEAATGTEVARPPRQLQLQHRPGAGVSALYELPAAAGFIGMTTETMPATEGTVRVEIPADAAPSSSGKPVTGPLVVSMWRHPHDPKLPGLRSATVEQEVWRIWGRDDTLRRLETVTYRPLRRAVVRAEFATAAPVVHTRRLYLKVMRAGLAEGLHRRHRVLHDAGLPVPRPVGEPVDDVVALAEVTGDPMSKLILQDGATSLAPGDLLELLDRLPEEALGFPRRPAWSDRLGRYASAAAVALPEHGERIGRLERHLARLLGSTDRGPVVPTHGDFYEANLLMEGNRISALLDVDGVGPGHRVDDLACLLGHLGVLPAVDIRYTRITEALDHFGGAFAAHVDPGALWARSAAVAVSLVAGARTAGASGWNRQALARLVAAEELADRAN
ncbi:aminoglycoside phosphotransferase family protein [Arthrobacter sp. KK5.5]|uniref:aminoglycoside phosphotransferase family protein n=1 Tax=Arthrobacter sp. KK5.5 TaxID=3373084 RepID=UPI003EE81370